MQNAYWNCSSKIWIMWNDDWLGEVVRDNLQHLTMQFNKNNVEILFTVVHTRCDAREKLELWEELEVVAQEMSLPWLVGGDFIVIRIEEEKEGGVDFTHLEAVDFNQCINNCALTELRYSGSKYTWLNGRIERACIFKRLDKVLCNQEFLNILPLSEVLHLMRQGSSHAPLHVLCGSEEEITVRPFKFLNFWTKHPNFKKIIEENWKVEFEGCPFIKFQSKIKKIKGVLAKWSKVTFGDVFQSIATLEDEIRVKECQLEINPTAENRSELNKAEAELKKYLYIEEEFWKQKAGMKWFKDGDMNTKFFHNYVKGMRKKLHIAEIQTEQGDMLAK
ncbi:uncharacterized protein [Solanum tuberosum]|uniref:uncharacterized protein n=1 Tax=Solanum tuberosum TaxID=4113 RepID=UPI00073A20F3|nr:PREDICTED: uncharacterized protein LOC107061936 [Solanum tuberosum]